MTQASKAIEAKTRILLALQNHPDGLRYMTLFQRVKEHIGSLTTFQKYLGEMETQEHSIRKEKDPDDSRATIFIANPESLQTELAFLEAFNQIKGLMEQPSFPILEEEWMKLVSATKRGRPHLSAKESETLLKHPFLTQKEKVYELVKISHTLLFKMWSTPNYNGGFVSIDGDDIDIHSKSMFDNLHHSDLMLQRILREGKKDPEKEMWLRQLHAYGPHVSPA